MGNVKAREGWDEAHLGASSQATESTPKDATHATCDLGGTSLTSHIKVRVIAILFPGHTNTEISCSKVVPELDTSDEESIINHDQEGVVSDKEGSGIEEGIEEDSDGLGDTRSTMVPTSTNCPSMDCHDTSTGHLSTNFDDTLLAGPSINSHDTSMAAITHPFIDNANHDIIAATHPSIKSHSASESTIHPGPSVNSHTTTTIHPSTNGHNLPVDTSELQPFFLALESTRTGRRRKCRDMSSLSLCLCGVSAQPESVGSIQCQRAGCETVWVSGPSSFLLQFKGIWLNQYSIIYNALGTLMWVQESGLVTHVC